MNLLKNIHTIKKYFLIESRLNRHLQVKVHDILGVHVVDGVEELLHAISHLTLCQDVIAHQALQQFTPGHSAFECSMNIE